MTRRGSTGGFIGIEMVVLFYRLKPALLYAIDFFTSSQDKCEAEDVFQLGVPVAIVVVSGLADRVAGVPAAKLDT